MGIFTRFRDIISSNINAILDKAEDPEKLIKLMIREMEDTLVEIKAACAGTMASSKKVQRQLDTGKKRPNWQLKREETIWPAKHWLKNAGIPAGWKVLKMSSPNTIFSSSNTRTIFVSLKIN